MRKKERKTAPPETVLNASENESGQSKLVALSFSILLLVALLHGGRELIAHEHRLRSAEQVEYLIPHKDGIIEVQERAAEGCEQQSDRRNGLAIGRELAQAVLRQLFLKKKLFIVF